MPDGTRILVLDDEHELLDALMLFLEGRGFQVLPTTDAAEASEMIAGGHADLAIIDIGEHGLRLLREATTRNIPSILISGRPVIFEIGGIGDVLQKPFPFSALAERIDAVLRRYSPMMIR